MQILALKGREAGSELINLNKETEASCSNRSENSSEINLDISRAPAPAAADHESPAAMNGHRGLPFYASASAAVDQLLHSGHPSPAAAAPKMELGHGATADTPSATPGGSFGSLLCGAVVDEQPPFWPWADGHHNFQ